MREIKYTVSLDGVTPSNVQFGGMQGEHNATRLNVTINTELFTKLEGAAYRFEAEDGAGCRQTIAMGEIESENVVCSVPQSVTCNGGNVTIRLIFSKVAETEIEYILYSFPIRLRFDLTSNGEFTESKDASDISAAVALAKGYTEKAEQAANNAENAAETAVNARNGIEQEIAESLTNAKESGEFDGKDGVSVTHEWNGTELTVTSASGTSSVDLKGDKGDKGDKGEQGIQGIQGVQGETGAKGDKGDDGVDGVGIETIVIENSNLKITLTNDTTLDLGNIKGEKGDTGATGATGAQGEQGIQGEKGETGATGATGNDGVSIVGTEINNKGELIITLSDNTVSNLGVVVGAKGDKGDAGATGATGEKGDKGDKGDRGEKGEDGADYILTDDDKNEIATQVSGDCVSYSKAQNLTDEQKQTARTNIDAVSQTELEDGLDEKVDASLVVSNILSDTDSGLIVLRNNIPNGSAVTAFVREHGVSSSQTQSLTLIQKARARQNIDVDGGKWELLYTIEGDGATNTWEFTKFADGSDLKLRAATVKTINTVAASADTYGFIYAYDSSSNLISTAVITRFLSKTAGAVALGIIEQDKGYYRAYSVGGAKNNPGNVGYSGFQRYKEIGNIEITPYIPKIKVENQTTAYLPVGSTIEVWGVKA